MRATPPARALAFLVDVLDRFWGLICLAVVIALVTLWFVPNHWTLATLVAAIVGAALAAVWVRDGWL